MEMQKEGGVSRWRASLAHMPTARTLSCLSYEEHDKAKRFVSDVDRRRYLAAHVHLRNVLAFETGWRPQDIILAAGPFGKPFLPSIPRCEFNMSHCGDVVVVATAVSLPVGVDVEVERPLSETSALADNSFTPAERSSLTRFRTANQARMFLLGWTRKEACLKAGGWGLSIDPKSFEVGISLETRSVTIKTSDGTSCLALRSYADGDGVFISVACHT